MKKAFIIAGLFASLGLSAASSKEIVRHRIQPSETVFRISLIYNSTVNDIVKANPGINPKILGEGAIIKVPKNTKIRDAAFVESFLNGQPELSQMPSADDTKPAPMKKTIIEIPIRNITPAPSEIKAEKTVEPKKVETPMPASEPEQATIKTERSADMKVNIISTPAPAFSHAQIEDENPFLTPSEPRSSPSASDEQPVKEEIISEPASASKNKEIDEENPFITPKHKNEAKKSPSKSGATETSSTQD